ncbi:DUF4232 domain-containing protein [Streptomyces sp. NPDC006540]|jgi:hypothetical protein|uniref:DUF4232 domain-containing protein n=1 Tax=Streptomyces sp. NPDC006540 TaxID=3155353 RepID=UPI00339DE38F
MRTNLIRTTAVAATALIAALSLTACQSDAGARDEGTALSTSAPATQKPTPDPTAAPTSDPARSASPAGDKPAGNDKGNSGDSTGTTGSAGGAAAGSGGGSEDPGPVMTACGADVKVTYSTVRRPINHALLTMTNTGSEPCNAYHAPLLRFDDAQAATAVDQDSRPQAVVTIAPGESAYASIMLAAADGSGNDGHTAARLAVSFAPRSGSGSTDAAPAVIRLPADTYTDTTTTVSHWQSSMDDALMY